MDVGLLAGHRPGAHEALGPPLGASARLSARFWPRKRRAHSLFLVALGLLFLAARTNQRNLFLPALALYVLAAGWWVFEDQRTPGGGRRTRRWALGALVAAGLALLAWRLGADDGAFVAVVLAYLGVGTLLTEARDRLFHGAPAVHTAGWRGRWARATGRLRARRHLLGPCLLLGCAVTGGAGLAMLGTSWSGRGIALLLAAALVVPIGLGLLSEDLITRLTVDRGEHLPLLLGLGGLALAAFALVLLPIEAGTLVVLALFAGLLVLGQTSNTQTDIVLLVAVTAGVLYLTADEVPDSALQTLPGTGPAVVALGDSYMSGEGARAYYEGTDDPSRNACRRAPTAYAARLAGTDPRVPRLTFLACSGAVAAHVHARSQHPGEPRAALLPRDVDAPGLPQVAQVRTLHPAPADVPFVLLSIGGNDSGFSTIGMTCVAPGNCAALAPLWQGALTHVRRQVGVAYDEVRDALPGVPVVVVPYPLPLSDTARCPSVWLDRSERQFLTGFVTDLNGVLQREAARAGFWFVETMQDSLAGQRLCDGKPRDLGINFIGLRSVSGLPGQSLDPSNWVHNSLHPNERGHEAMAGSLSSWLDAHPDLAAGPPTGPGRLLTEQERAAAGRPDPEAACDVADPERGCRAQATRWALGEVRDNAVHGLVPLAGLVGLWLSSLGALAAVRRRRANAG